MSDSWSHLDMCLLLTNNSPSLDILSHLRPLPLLIDYSNGTRIATKKDDVNIHLGLQQHGRVRRIALQAASSSLCMWLELMNKLFPRLGDLSLTSTTTDEMSLVLPGTFRAPDLRRLSLHGIGLPKESSILFSMNALSILSLTHIGLSCYIPPRRLITQLQDLPHLEQLSIGFAIPVPLPSRERELLPALIPPVTLPTLRRLTFRGVGVYLDNLVAQINTPLLEQLNLTLLFEIVFSLVNLAEFIHRTEGFGCLVSRVTFNAAGPFIDTEQRVLKKLSLRINCEPLDWQVDSAAQVCSTLWKVLSSVEVLTVDLDVNGMPSDWKNTLDDMLWHDLLLPFTGVKKLRIGSSLTFELSQALDSVAGGLVLELLPELQALEIELEMDQAKTAVSVFVETRESVGRPIHLLVSPLVPRTNPGTQYTRQLWPPPLEYILPSSGVVVPQWLWMPAPREEPSAPRALTVRRAGNDEETPPKKEYRRGHNTHENKRRLYENPQRRANENWRYQQQSRASRINARISQPGGKIAI